MIARNNQGQHNAPSFPRAAADLPAPDRALSSSSSTHTGADSPAPSGAGSFHIACSGVYDDPGIRGGQGRTRRQMETNETVAGWLVVVGAALALVLVVVWAVA